jgi:hypothetical protein
MSYGVCCVIGDSEQDEISDFVEAQCMEAGIPFTIRVFDSWTFTEDRDHIKSLPAFHIYKNKIRYKITIGSEENIMEVVTDYIHKKKEKAAKKRQRWLTFFGFIKRRGRQLVEWPRH